MYLLIRRLSIIVATLVFVIAVTGCAESSRQVASGKGNIRGINAIATAPDVNFMIEERRLSALQFKAADSYSPFDDLSYNFSFDVFLPLELNAMRLATQFIDVQADHEYTVVLTGSFANPSIVFWEDEFREWQDSETVSEIIFAHLAPSMDELDIYFAAPGTVPMAGQKVGTLENGDRLPGMDFAAEEFEMVLTPGNDPGTIIYRSAPVNLSERTRVLFAIFDGDPTLPGNVGVNFIEDSGRSTVLPDVNSPPQIRTLHTALGTESFDGYFDSDFDNIIYPDIEFKERSLYADAPEVDTLLTLTPVGNSGATIHEGNVVSTPINRRTVVLAGMPGDLVFGFLLDNARPSAIFPLARFLNVAFNIAAVDIYILEPGTPIDEDSLALIQGLPPGVDTGFNDLPEGMREITVTLAGETTPISAPVILDFANEDVKDIVVVDTVDPTQTELLVFDTHSNP
jgi:hypothetical protein